MNGPGATITPASGDADIAIVRALFLEYGESLDFDLCFQDFDTELAELPGAYAPPEGAILLARVDGAPAGTVALRPLDSDVCEMKRLYVKPEHRGHALGRRLAEAILETGARAGYRAMRLDTIGATMLAARMLYEDLGFREIPPYYENPIPSATYFEIDLTARR
jgi:ribosomal protein S18 acetylase RimI-like enzyme